MSAPAGLHLPALHAPSECAADLRAWSLSGPRLTVVAKIAFPLAPGEGLELLARPEMIERDRHHERAPARSLEAASDLAPLLPGAEIVVVGSAHAPRGMTVASRRVALSIVSSGGTGLTKRLDVVGDRRSTAEAPRPFSRLPLVWERALRGPDNPVGVEPRTRLPNLLHTDDPNIPTGLGPLSAGWAARRGRLGDAPRGGLESEPLELWAGFDFGYFFCAPPDQRLHHLDGDEWLLLEGLHPDHPRLQLRLPGVRLALRAVAADGATLSEPRMVADRLTLNTDSFVGTVTYRCGLAHDWSRPSDVRLLVGSSRGAAPLCFADPTDPATSRGRHAASLPANPTMVSAATVALPAEAALKVGTVMLPGGPATAAVDPDAMKLGALPFEELAKLARERKAPTQQPPRKDALPFGAGGEPAAPKPAVAPAEGVRSTVALDPSALAEALAAIGHAAPAAPPAAASPPAPPPIAPPPIAAPPPAQAATQAIDPAAQRLAELPFEQLMALARDLEAKRPDAQGVQGTLPLDPEALAAALMPFSDLPVPRAPRAPAPLEGLPFLDLRSGPESGEAVPPSLAGPPKWERSSDVVPLHTDTALSLASIAWEVEPPDAVRVVIAKATFELIEGGPARLCDEAELPSADVFIDDDVDKALLVASDYAVLKHEVDVLVRGDAFAAGGQATAGRVGVKVEGADGSIDRSLAVFGDRTWRGGALSLLPSEPAPWTRMPLTFDRAFGGPGFAANPLGVGHRGAAGPDGERRLPNLEPMGKLIASPGDTPEPASLGPVPLRARAAWGSQGSYDAAWLASRWPYLPKDFDYVLMQAAQKPQRLRRARGDERYQLLGLHPERAVLSGALAGVGARAFAARTQAVGGGFVEIPMRLDTITFVPAEGRVHLVWRGLIAVSDDDAPELAGLFATLEPLDVTPISVADAEARYRAALVRKPEEGAPEPEPEPPPPPAAANDDDESARAPFLRRLAELEASLGVEEGAGPPLEPLPPEAVAAHLRQVGASEDDIAQLVGAMGRSTTEPPPPVRPALRPLVEERLARGEPLAGLDLRAADLSELDLSGRDLSGADLSHASLARADLTGATLVGAQLVRANLSEARLDRAALAGADLSQARLGGASLVEVDLKAADLSGCRARGLDLTGAKLGRARLAGASLDEAKLDRADLTGADLTGASLARASLREAKLTRARLYDVRASHAVFDRADLTNARGDSAVLASASLRDVAADESVWEAADLTGACFAFASLRNAGLTRTTCVDAVFTGCDLRLARLRKADLSAANLVRANLMEAVLDRAVLDRADLRGANLYACSMDRTSAVEPRLELADLTRTPWESRTR